MYNKALWHCWMGDRKGDQPACQTRTKCGKASTTSSTNSTSKY